MPSLCAQCAPETVQAVGLCGLDVTLLLPLLEGGEKGGGGDVALKVSRRTLTGKVDAAKSDQTSRLQRRSGQGSCRTEPSP